MGCMGLRVDGSDGAVPCDIGMHAPAVKDEGLMLVTLATGMGSGVATVESDQ